MANEYKLVTVNKKVIDLGYFSDIKDAIKVRKDAEISNNRKPLNKNN